MTLKRLLFIIFLLVTFTILALVTQIRTAAETHQITQHE